MSELSRREFGKIALAGVPLAAFGTVALGASPLVLGVTTSSLRDLPRVEGRDNVDDVIRALREVGARHVELALANVEPAPPSTAPFLGGSQAYPQRIVLTPEQVAATNAAYRGTLRGWRLQTPVSTFQEVQAKFEAAGITVHACALGYDASFTDEEIDATFRQIKALGVATVSARLTLSAAARLAPFAERHRLAIAIHNQLTGNAAGEISTPQLHDALALSPAFKLKLDIGHLTASNSDAVAELRAHRARVAYVVVRDRLRNGGRSQPFGEGDTPIANVLGLLKASPSVVPAFSDYDYLGLHSSVDEVKASLAYLAQAGR
jgi:sugar phosphate isomerase/epimerase